MDLAIASPRFDFERNGIWALLALALVAAAFGVPNFGTPDNLANIGRQAAVLGILAIGQTFVITAGLIDLSIGSLTGLVVVLSCALIDGDPLRTLPVAAAMLALGAGVGLLNGLLLNWLRLNPLILTFGMLSILQGTIFSFTDRSVGRTSPLLSELANGSLYGIPWSILLLTVLLVGGHFLLTRSAFGYHLLAAGGKPDSARRAGIHVERIRLAVFVISGVTAGVAGLVLAGRLGTGYPLAGNGLELDAIVAVVLGGTALSGGRGSVLRSLGGVFLLAILSNVLNLLEVSAFVQTFVKGVIVIAAILVNQARRA